MELKKIGLGVLATACLASNAWSLSVNTAPGFSQYVGNTYDQLLQTDTGTGLDSYDLDGQTAWVNSVLAPSNVTVEAASFIDPDDGQTLYRVNENTANGFAFKLLVNADYFVINRGNKWALFENNNDRLDWAVFTDPAGWNLPDSDKVRISYFSEFDTAAVPVPAAAWLFGSALVGLMGVARKRKQA